MAKEEINRDFKKDDPPYPMAADFFGVNSYFNEIIFKDNNPHVIFCAEPRQINERMTAQQGLLLGNINDKRIFSTTLLEMLFQNKSPVTKRQVISKIKIERNKRLVFLEELRKMNIQSASLFPGLGGFAKSLKSNLEIRMAHQLEDHIKLVSPMLKKSGLKSKIKLQANS